MVCCVIVDAVISLMLCDFWRVCCCGLRIFVVVLVLCYCQFFVSKLMLHCVVVFVLGCL